MNVASVCWLLVVVVQAIDARWITGNERRSKHARDERSSRSSRQSLLVDAVLERWLVLRLGS